MLKKITAAMFLFLFALSMTGCFTLEFEKKSKDLPPGQEKKIEGEQSAKDFAPGQEKKN